jgi:hypothetical protein
VPPFVDPADGRNRAPVDRPWFTICTTPPVSAWLVMANVPRMMNPRWAIDE